MAFNDAWVARGDAGWRHHNIGMPLRAGLRGSRQLLTTLVRGPSHRSTLSFPVWKRFILPSVEDIHILATFLGLLLYGPLCYTCPATKTFIPPTTLRAFPLYLLCLLICMNLLLVAGAGLHVLPSMACRAFRDGGRTGLAWRRGRGDATVAVVSEEW